MSERSANPPLGTTGDLRRRLLLHHMPLALASAAALFLWMRLPLFDTAGHQGPPQASVHAAQRHGPESASRHGSPPSGRANRHMDHAGTEREIPEAFRGRRLMGRFTTGTGYVALGLLAPTLLIGPVNLILRKRNPVSTHLRRDIGAWTAIVSVVHVIIGLGVHGPPAPLGERILHYFIAPDGQLLTNAFGLGNWTGLAATVIVLGLLAISNDVALRKLKARPWKWLQRLNYVLFGLVIAHSIFYGALLRVTSPSTLLLGLSVIAVLIGQSVGVWLWRRRPPRTATLS